MLRIEKGKVFSPKIKQKIYTQLGKGAMPKINGIIVHQTFTTNAQQSFNSFAQGNKGTHFLIAKDGTIYQTALLSQKLNHVGPIKLRCAVEAHRKSVCTKEHTKAYNSKKSYAKKSIYEQKTRNVPNRYPANKDSLGIELVGKAYGGKNHEVYEKVTEAQNASLKWLVEELRKVFAIPASEVFTHPQVSRKNVTEASTAKWK